MSDIADRAQQEHDLHLSLQLKRRKPTLPVTGYCHWCSEEAPADARFCDADCRDDYQKHKQVKG